MDLNSYFVQHYNLPLNHQATQLSPLLHLAGLNARGRLETEKMKTGPDFGALKMDLCCCLAQAQEITIKHKGIWGSLLFSFIFHLAGHKYSPLCLYRGASLMAQMVKHLPAMWETWVGRLGQEDPLEKEMATHSSTLAWKIP